MVSGARRSGVTVNAGGGELPTFAIAPAPGVTMESWIAWLVLPALLGGAEVLTTTLVLGLLSVAALVAAIVGGVGLRLPFQLCSFALAPATCQCSVVPLTGVQH